MNAVWECTANQFAAEKCHMRQKQMLRWIQKIGWNISHFFVHWNRSATTFCVRYFFAKKKYYKIECYKMVDRPTFQRVYSKPFVFGCFFWYSFVAFFWLLFDVGTFVCAVHLKHNWTIYMPSTCISAVHFERCRLCCCCLFFWSLLKLLSFCIHRSSLYIMVIYFSRQNCLLHMEKKLNYE